MNLRGLVKPNHGLSEELVDQLETFDELRPLLFSIAYRMLGSAADAQDMVQEAYLRWQSAEHESVDSPRNYLAATVTRLCIDQLRSAHARRVEYVGPWLPEPVPTETVSEPSRSLELADSISTAFLLLLETLSPAERAAFLLRDVFDYEYSDIAEIVGKNEAACRQMIHRARERVAAGRPRFPTSDEQRERLTQQFVMTCATGDLDGLVQLLSDDVVLASDSGGKVNAARRIVRGADHVSRFMVGVVRRAKGQIEPRFVSLNGTPGLVVYVQQVPVFAMTLDFDGDRVRAVYITNNPDKLSALDKGGDEGS